MHQKHTKIYLPYMGMKPWKNGSIKIGLPNFVLVIFHSKAQRSGRPVEDDKCHIKAIIDSVRHSTTCEIAEKLKVSHDCIKKKLKQLSYVKKLNLWVPHQLKEIQLTQRVSICDSLLKRNGIDSFLKCLITGDEKWIVYNDVHRKRSWVKQDQPVQTTSKAVNHQNKIMLSLVRL